MAFYEKWQSERYSIGCKVWEARCPNCHELVESADPISSNYRFCPYCGFDMKSDFQRVADRRQFAEWLTELKELRILVAGDNTLSIQKLEMILAMLRAQNNDNDIALCELCEKAVKLQDRETELKEAKRLLKLAVEDANTEAESLCAFCKHNHIVDGCPYIESYSECEYIWRYTDEALKLIES